MSNPGVAVSPYGGVAVSPYGGVAVSPYGGLASPLVSHVGVAAPYAKVSLINRDSYKRIKKVHDNFINCFTLVASNFI